MTPRETVLLDTRPAPDFERCGAVTLEGAPVYECRVCGGKMTRPKLHNCAGYRLRGGME